MDARPSLSAFCHEFVLGTVLARFIREARPRSPCEAKKLVRDLAVTIVTNLKVQDELIKQAEAGRLHPSARFLTASPWRRRMARS